jgi:hypothetical protein
MRWQFASAALSLLIGLAIFAGCQTHRQVIEQAHQSFWEGDLDRSAAELKRAAERPKNDLAVLKLDQSMVEFQRGRFAESQSLLKEVKQQFADLPPLTQTTRSAVAYLTDDTRRAYTGEDHEKLLLQVMLALQSLLRSDGDAMAYAHQLGLESEALLESRPIEPTLPPAEQPPAVASDSPAPSSDSAQPAPEATQVFLADSPPAAPPVPKIDPIRFELAFAPLVRSLIRGQSALNHDDLVRNLRVANEWRPGSEFLQAELARAEAGELTPPGYGSLYVVGLVGRGPRKVTDTEEVTSQAMLVADQILSALGNYTLPPTVAPIKIARIELSPITVDTLRISVNGQELGCTENIADIGRLAMARQKEQMPLIVGRAVARRVLKKGMIVAGMSAAGAEKGSGNDLTSLVYTAAGVAWEAAEQADLRSWSLLPGSIQIYRIDLPAGEHRLDLRGELQGRTVSSRFSSPLLIRDGQATFAIATLPDRSATGRVFVTE